MLPRFMQVVLKYPITTKYLVMLTIKAGLYLIHMQEQEKLFRHPNISLMDAMLRFSSSMKDLILYDDSV